MSAFQFILLFCSLIASKAVGQRPVDSTFTGHHIEYIHRLPQDSIKSYEGDYVAGKKQGKWVSYHNDGITVSSVYEFVNDKKMGPYSKYYPGGVLKEQGFKVDQLNRDSLKCYHFNGKLQYEAFFDQTGKEQGRINYYYDDGQLEYTLVVVDGKELQQARYSRDGKIREVPTTKTGSIVKSCYGNDNFRTYTDNGSFELDGELKDGELWNGKKYIYDSDGILFKVEVYKDGKYHSTGHL